jgi:hypothetical protein
MFNEFTLEEANCKLKCRSDHSNCISILCYHFNIEVFHLDPALNCELHQEFVHHHHFQDPAIPEVSIVRKLANPSTAGLATAFSL